VTSLGAIVFVTAAGLSAVMVMLVRRWAERRLLDHPNERSSHVAPKPRGGGLAIVIVTLGGLLLLQRCCSGLPLRHTLTLVLCGAAVAVVSWLDDLRSVPAAARFAVHLGAAAATAAAIGWWSEMRLPGVGTIHLGTAGLVLTIVWIAGLTNAYNFMDGIDGIAGLQGVIAGAGWALLGAMTGAAPLVVIGLLLAGSTLGFLLHNWQPARIFMGDVGAAFLGYELAALTVAASRIDARLSAAGVLLVWPFVFDTIYTFLRRARRRERVFHAHRSHLYQRLEQSGLSHATVALIYGELATLGVAAAAAVATGMGAGWALATVGSTMVGLVALVVRRERERQRFSSGVPEL
jgi:UDP-N-acetylmuramyl pentapeptide phosphotransferase/UDP-N-acetylglucosamine-1-phosphate transferase